MNIPSGMYGGGDESKFIYAWLIYNLVSCVGFAFSVFSATKLI